MPLMDDGKVDKVPVTWEGLRSQAVDVIAMVIKKNHDYGDAWQALGVAGAAARFTDKVFRVERLGGGIEALVTNEKLEDTIRDLVGYGLLILLYLDHQKGEDLHV